MPELMSEFSKIRDRQLAYQRKRQEAAFALCPDLQALVADYTQAQIRKGMAYAQNKNAQALAELDEQIQQKAQAIEKVLTKHNLPKNDLELQYCCDLCKDYGYVNGEPCVCYKKRIFEKRTSQANLTKLEKENFASFNLLNFPQENHQREQMEKLKGLCEKYCNTFNHTDKLNILIRGSTGLGKSFMLNCIGARVLERGFHVRKITANEFVEIIIKNVIKQNNYEPLYALQRAELLIIDDLGSEPSIKNITENYFFSLVNERIMANKHTVYATNQTPSQLFDRYGERTAPRLLDVELTLLAQLNGKDIRLLRKE